MVFHDFGSKFNLQQNRHHLNALFMLITMVQIPASYLIPSPRYLAQYIAQTFVKFLLHVSSVKCKTHRTLVHEYSTWNWELYHCDQHENSFQM